MFENLLNNSSFWSPGEMYSDIVMSTRLRLLRNQADIPFGAEQTEVERQKVDENLELFCHSSSYKDDLTLYRMSDISDIDRRFLRERNIISGATENNLSSLLLFDDKSRFNIAVGSDDHYHMQVLRSGFSVYDGYSDIVALDNEFNKYVSYAFSSKFGYLTSNLDNSGTGLKVSVLMHLPVLTIMGTILEVKKMAGEIGGHFTAVTGDKNKNYGSLFLLSSKGGTGMSEVDIVELVDDLVKMIVDLEVETRDDYVSDFSSKLEDMVWRSYGILKYARSISYVEALEYLSTVRLGVILAILKDVKLLDINDLLVKSQPGHLLKISGETLNLPEEYDAYRAEFIRQNL
jgi:protein arginine kinase